MTNKVERTHSLQKLFVSISNIIILALLVWIWATTWMQNYAAIIARPFGYKGNWLVFFLYAIILGVITHIYGGYRVGHYRQMDIFFSGSMALILTNGISYIQTCLLGARMLPLLPVVWATLGGMVVILVWSVTTQWLFRRFYPPYRMLMVYCGKEPARALINKMIQRHDKYQVCEAVDLKEGLEFIKQKMPLFQSVIFSDIPSAERNLLLKYAYANHIPVYVTPKLSDILIRGAETIELFDSPLLLSQNNDLSLEQKAGKRVMDIFISIVGILLTAPFMLAVAVAIKLDDGGPVFYTQPRLTQNRKIFSIYKFRTMIVNADKVAGNCLATEDDPRITRVGKFLRKTRMDELPQLFNILKGEMSVVGPRPEHPDIAVVYEKSIPEFAYRLHVKAGLTGYAQVIGKYNTTPYDKIKLDLMYITSYSFLLDIKIILMTSKIIFKSSSTEGLARGESIAKIYNTIEEDENEKIH